MTAVDQLVSVDWEPGGDWPGLEWRHVAACRGLDTNLWFAEAADRATNAMARAVCRRCPVASECLAWAVATRQTYGVWGGVRAGTVEWDRRREVAR